MTATDLFTTEPGTMEVENVSNESPRFGKLTPREKEVLQLIAKGLANDEIAKSLFISKHTVKNHITNIYRKMGSRNRTKVALWAIRYGLISVD
ncbi:MAG: response regulator transcription factor [Firmicutes bacterium]|jgi:DNA-binding NarL/FixJ family response regulator|nr:response regulator transcription factor [Bacillota bacterium]